MTEKFKSLERDRLGHGKALCSRRHGSRFHHRPLKRGVGCGRCRHWLLQSHSSCLRLRRSSRSSTRTCTSGTRVGDHFAERKCLRRRFESGLESHSEVLESAYSRESCCASRLSHAAGHQIAVLVWRSGRDLSGAGILHPRFGPAG